MVNFEEQLRGSPVGFFDYAGRRVSQTPGPVLCVSATLRAPCPATSPNDALSLTPSRQAAESGSRPTLRAHG